MTWVNQISPKVISICYTTSMKFLARTEFSLREIKPRKKEEHKPIKEVTNPRPASFHIRLCQLQAVRNHQLAEYQSLFLGVLRFPKSLYFCFWSFKVWERTPQDESRSALLTFPIAHANSLVLKISWGLKQHWKIQIWQRSNRSFQKTTATSSYNRWVNAKKSQVILTYWDRVQAERWPCKTRIAT